ncbi:MAG: FAD:protein FMN transferase [Firmicutes bacterium]|nr:FAD:protein FMN transferase [Bacillota bacterium]
MIHKGHREETRLLMGTIVSIDIVGENQNKLEEAMSSAFEAMGMVEAICNRFDEHSALRALCRRPGEWVRVPDVLFEALRVARELSELTDGAFDPTVGAKLACFGFTRHYVTGEMVATPDTDPTATFQDISLDETTRQVYLQKPMLLDLGAVAKGLAIDLAAGVLQGWDGFAINAGGDVYVHGEDPLGEPWTIGIQHPDAKDKRIAWLRATDIAVCTSGTYERRSPVDPAVHHLLATDRNTGEGGLVSCTVIAPLAVLADAVSTAAFVLGEHRALDFIEDAELAGLCINDQLQMQMNDAMRRYVL